MPPTNDDLPDFASSWGVDPPENSTTFQALTATGVKLPPPSTLGPNVGAVLQMLIDEMAKRKVYVMNTDHLNDGQLYEWLYTHGLKESELGFMEEEDFLMLDPVADDHHTYLRFYVDEEQRRQWRDANPDDDMPPKETPPYHRDQTLPRPPGWETTEGEE